MSYVASLPRPPRTLTEDEQRKILKITGDSRRGFRDHMIISFAIGTSLREHEIAALDVGDVWDGTKVRRRVVLRVFKRARPAKVPGKVARRPPVQEIFLPDKVVEKLEHYVRVWLVPDGADQPLFPAQGGARIATRTLRRLFRVWQLRAGFKVPYPFHCLRHTGVTNLYRATRDIRKAQKMARHANIDTTMIYTHVSDEEQLAAVRKLPA